MNVGLYPPVFGSRYILIENLMPGGCGAADSFISASNLFRLVCSEFRHTAMFKRRFRNHFQDDGSLIHICKSRLRDWQRHSCEIQRQNPDLSDLDRGLRPPWC